MQAIWNWIEKHSEQFSQLYKESNRQLSGTCFIISPLNANATKWSNTPK